MGGDGRHEDWERVSYLVSLFAVRYCRYMCAAAMPYLRDIKRWVRSAFSSGQTTPAYARIYDGTLRNYGTVCFFFWRSCWSPVEMMVVVHACVGEPDARETTIWRHRGVQSSETPVSSQESVQTSRFLSSKHSKYSLIAVASNQVLRSPPGNVLQDRSLNSGGSSS